MAATLVFALVRLIPGDPTLIVLGDYATQEQIAQARDEMGLDRPLHEQYIVWLQGAVTGDFGTSYRTREPVGAAILERLPATLELAAFSILLAILVGLPAGILAAVFRGRVIDHVVTAVALIGLAMPVFWIGMMLLMVFSLDLGLLPSGGRSGSLSSLDGPTGYLVLDSLIRLDPAALGEAARHLALPVVVLAWYPFATIARITRSAMLEVIQQDYVRTAWAKGLNARAVITRHALKNALIPVVTVVGLSIGPLMSGAVLTETVFSWPGLGRYTVDSVLGRDLPAVQAVVLLAAVGFTVINLLTDIIYAVVDPRIAYE